MIYSTKTADCKEKSKSFFRIPLFFFENDEIPQNLKDLFILISSSLFNEYVSYEFLNWKYNGGVRSPYLVKSLKKLQDLGVITFKKAAFGRKITINYDYFAGQRFVNIPRNSNAIDLIYKYKNERLGLLTVFVYHYLNFGLKFSTNENHASKIGISVKTYRKYSRILLKEGILTENVKKKYLESTAIPIEIRNIQLCQKHHTVNHRSFYLKNTNSLIACEKISANENNVLNKDKKHTFAQQEKYLIPNKIYKINLITPKQFLRFFIQKKGIIDHWKEHKKKMNIDDSSRHKRNLGFYFDLDPKLKIYFLKAIKNKVHLSGEILDLKNVELRMNDFISKTIADGKDKTFESDNQFICYMSKIVSSINNRIYKYSDLLLDENLYILQEIEHNLRFEEDSNYNLKYIMWKVRTLARSNPDFKSYSKTLIIKHLMNILKKDFRAPGTTRDWDADYGFNGFSSKNTEFCDYSHNEEEDMLYDEGQNSETKIAFNNLLNKIREKTNSAKTFVA